MIYEGRLQAGEHFLLDVFTNHHLLTISNSSKRPLFPYQPHISSFLLIVKRVNKFAHKALSRPAGCRSNAMSRCFNLHQKCHCQPWDRTWYLYTVNRSQDRVYLVEPSSSPARVGTLIVAQQSFVTEFELEQCTCGRVVLHYCDKALKV